MDDLHHPDEPKALRAILRADLRSAMKARQPDTIAALRSVLAAIDNAEAVTLPPGDDLQTSGPIAGASSGVGSTEAARRVLTTDDLRVLLDDEIETRIATADQFERHHRPDEARRLRQEADVLREYLVT